MWERHLPKKERKVHSGKPCCVLLPRFSARDGKRHERHFDTPPEARNWLADAQYENKHGVVLVDREMTVDRWFTYWIDNLICDLAPNIRRNYRERYETNIQPIIGSMAISDVKPMHCKTVLNRMETTYVGSTIRQTYIAMGTMFKAALMDDIISKRIIGAKTKSNFK